MSIHKEKFVVTKDGRKFLRSQAFLMESKKVSDRERRKVGRPKGEPTEVISFRIPSRLSPMQVKTLKLFVMNHINFISK